MTNVYVEEGTSNAVVEAVAATGSSLSSPTPNNNNNNSPTPIRTPRSKIEIRRNSFYRCSDKGAYEIYIASHRILPNILFDHHKMTDGAWEDFCDSINDTLGPIDRTARKIFVGFCLVSLPLFFLLRLTTNRVFGITSWVGDLVYWIGILVSTVIAVVLQASAGSRAIHEAKKIIADTCARFSDNDPGLVLKLHAEEQTLPSKWFIEVNILVRNNESDLEAGR